MPPAPGSDRNLLFGVLALQADLVTRDQLVAAMNAWVVEKATPLAEVLVRQGALSAEDRSLIEPLVARHLARHGDDAQKSLAAVSSVSPSVRAALARVPDPDVQASLLALPGTAPDRTPPEDGRPGGARSEGGRPRAAVLDSTQTQAASVVTREADGLRYRVLRPHARGGLGEVFVAMDAEVHREVALKEIRDPAADDPEARARFLLEAEVTGRLEHPGVVPVYGLGAYPDGRPFYAMRFVRGDSLAEAIERYHSPAGKALPAGERNLAFRDLLRRFVDVCETIAYAHSRGVLHRDLKPGNVMLGRYGETLVVDWGLAKATGRPDLASSGDTALRPSGSGTAATQAGRVVGTPSYMSPEQAEGRLDLLGPASDVYSLGATLYCLLTGRPPAEGADVHEVLRKVRAGDLVPPRRHDPAVPKPLEAVCLKATAARPEARYASAKALAEDVEHWLADEPVSALPESPTRKAARWVRRHRTESATAAAALTLLLVAAGTFGWWYEQVRAERAAEAAAAAAERRTRAEAARGDVAEAIGRAAELREQARWAAARSLLAAAGRRLAEADDGSLAARVRTARADLAAAAALDDVRVRKTAGLVTRSGRPDYSFANGRGGAYAAATAAYLEGLGRPASDLWDAPPGELGRLVAGSAIAPHLVAAFDDWAVDEADPAVAERVLGLARVADPDPTRVRLRDPAVRRDAAALADLASRLGAGDLAPPTVRALAKLLRNGGRREESADLLARGLARHPDDFWLHFSRAFVSDSLGRGEEALAHARAALVARPDVTAARHNLVVNLLGLGRAAEAEAACREALALAPGSPLLLVDLGAALRRLGRPRDAEAEYRRAVAADRRYVPAHLHLAFLLDEQGRPADAESSYRDAVAAGPEDPAARDGLGVLLANLGRAAEAEAEFRRAVALDGGDVTRRARFAAILAELRRWAEAAAEYARASELAPDAAIWPCLRVKALLAGGDVPAARAAAAALFGRFAATEDPDAAAQVLDAFLLHAGPPDPAVTDRLCRLAAASRYDPTRGVAAAHYRSGRYADAVAAVDAAAASRPADASEALLAAAAARRLGAADAAARYAEALRTLAAAAPPRWDAWWERHELEALRREAESLFADSSGGGPPAGHLPPVEAARPRP